MNIKIAPSILSADFGAFNEAVVELHDAGADYVHIDVMDGHYVPNITFGPMLVSALRPVTSVPFDTHLMIENPERYIGAFVKAGSNIITVHPETTYHLHRLIYQIKEAGVRPGVALNPSTPISAIEWILADVDRVLVMTVDPGFGGQAFISDMLQKVRALAECRSANGHRFEIGVDGGVNADTARLVAKAGADVLIAGSAVFHHPDGVATAVAELRRAANGKP
ncbi:MAG: ribulose-phosphate 3-epimerase [Capsulimonadaceae bacterium]